MIVQLVVAAGSREGQVIPVSVKKFIIGRAADCHLKSKSELISRYHCAILVGDEAVVRDLGSKNGVRLNGERISVEQQLMNGDNLVVGPLEFYVRIATGADSPAGKSTKRDYQLSGVGENSDIGPLGPSTVSLGNLK